MLLSLQFVFSLLFPLWTFVLLVNGQTLQVSVVIVTHTNLICVVLFLLFLVPWMFHHPSSHERMWPS